MKHFLLIFALLIASCDEEHTIQCKSVAIQISDANPIQFWPVDCLTYNENEVCGIHPKCWCHPWECDDEIPTQFTDTDPFEEYSLVAYNSDSEVLATIPFTSSDKFYTETDFEFSNNQFLVSLTGWSQYSSSPGTSVGWNWNSPGANVDGTAGTLSNTYNIHQTRQQAVGLGIGDYDKFPAGSYTFRVRINNYSTGGSSPLSETFAMSAFNTPGVGGVQNGVTVERVSVGIFVDYDVTLTTDQDYTYFGFGANKQGPSAGSVIKMTVESITIIDYPLDYTLTAYSNSFIPNEENICDEQVQFKIESDLSSPAEVAKSDCIDIRTTQSCTKVINYSNNRNFAGLIYTGLSPEQVFNIRVPAIFFHEQFPEEDEAMELTTGIQKTSGTLKVQRLFDTDYLPYYMHKKLQLIFKHQFITIDGLSWLKEEKYEIQPGERRWPVKKAKCFLTQDYIQRAVL